MTELTPLERELLNSVNALQSGFEQDAENYKISLKQAVEQQSAGMQKWQTEIETRLNEYELRQKLQGEEIKALQQSVTKIIKHLQSSSTAKDEAMSSLQGKVENLIKALSR